MTQPTEGIRAGDADRDVAASALADAVADGRLSPACLGGSFRLAQVTAGR